MLILVPPRPLQAKSRNLDGASLHASSEGMLKRSASKHATVNSGKVPADSGRSLALSPRAAAVAPLALASAPPLHHTLGSNLEYRRRHLPRWTEISGLSLGLGAVITGATMHAMNDRCLKKEKGQCSALLDSSHLGRAAWIAGTQIFLTSLVFLLIDEWPRARRRRGSRR